MGVVSDHFRVRKPFMVLGGALAAAMTVVYLLQAGHHPSYYTLAVILALGAFFLGVAYTPWMASYRVGDPTGQLRPDRKYICSQVREPDRVRAGPPDGRPDREEAPDPARQRRQVRAGACGHQGPPGAVHQARQLPQPGRHPAEAARPGCRRRGRRRHRDQDPHHDRRQRPPRSTASSR